MDSRIDAFQNQLDVEQENGKAAKKWGEGYGQTLVGNRKPTDQEQDGPQMPDNLKDSTAISPLDGPRGLGYEIFAQADEAGVYYLKIKTKYEGEPSEDSGWSELDFPYFP
jgi:hypothetical protein